MRSRRSLAALVAAAMMAGVDVFYVLLISAQEDTGVGDSRVLFVAGCLAVAAICTAIGALIPDGPLRVVLLAASGCTLLAWTFLGIFSIGILLVLPTILTIRSAAQAAGPWPASSRTESRRQPVSPVLPSWRSA